MGDKWEVNGEANGEVSGRQIGSNGEGEWKVNGTAGGPWGGAATAAPEGDAEEPPDFSEEGIQTHIQERWAHRPLAIRYARWVEVLASFAALASRGLPTLTVTLGWAGLLAPALSC